MRSNSSRLVSKYMKTYTHSAQLDLFTFNTRSYGVVSDSIQFLRTIYLTFSMQYTNFFQYFHFKEMYNYLLTIQPRLIKPREIF